MDWRLTWDYVKAFALPVAIVLFILGTIAVPFIERLIPDTVGFETQNDPSTGVNAHY